MATFPYSCQTGHYTIDQLDGEDCAKCGRPFGGPYDHPRPVPHERVAEWQTYRHRECPKAVSTR